MTSKAARAEPGLTCEAHVRQHTQQTVRTFLDEVTNGTKDYRTIFSLTDQLRQQYLGRFAHELLQNAHDAIQNAGTPGRGRVKLEFAPDDGEFGTVYAANDGQPFTSDNFGAIAELAQSSKDPTKDIGHKGIGFKSVLQITSTPEVYSKAVAGSTSFDGYCFRFDPAQMQALQSGLANLERVGTRLAWSHGESSFKVEFERAEALRKSGRSVAAEVAYLSPYKLPVTCRPSGARLAALAAEGYSTVIRLPLLDVGAITVVKEALESLDGETILFLRAVRSLEVDAGAGARRFGREEVPAGAGSQVTITEEGRPARVFRLWRRRFAAAEPDATELARALEKLGKQWERLRAPEAALAIERSDVPRPGRYYAFLPTAATTGVAAHFDAPFFLTIDRKSIQWDVALNEFLRRCLLALTGIALKDLGTGGEAEARMVVDLLAPLEVTTWSLAAMMATALDELPLVLTAKGWRRLADIRLLPIIATPAYLTPVRIRAAATFDVASEALDSRRSGLEALFRLRNLQDRPMATLLAATVEKVAAGLLAEKDGTWAGFWRDVTLLLPGNASVLRERKVFLDEEGTLRAAGGDAEPARLFTRDAPREGEQAVPSVPPALSHLVAFLSQEVEGGSRRPTSPVLQYLTGVVDTFDRRSLLRRLIGAATGTEASESLREEILAWSVQLVQTARQEEGLLAVMAEMPLPCAGGWFAAKTAFEGIGWHEGAGRGRGLGRRLDEFLAAAATPEASVCRLRLLRPPTDPAWRGLAHVIEPWLDKMQVFDGIAPVPFPGISFSAKGIGVGVADVRTGSPPSPLHALQWDEWKGGSLSSFRAETARFGTYEVKDLTTLPGIDAHHRLDPAHRRELAQLVAASMSRWPQSWSSSTITRTAPHTVRSLLAYQLAALPWIPVELDEEWRFMPPGGTWYVPRLSTRQRASYQHLLPVAPELAATIEASGAAKDLQLLGLRIYDDGAPTPPGLLQAMAEARPLVRDVHQDTWLAQIRDAWANARPDQPGVLPAQVVVRRGEAIDVVSLAQETTYVPTTSYRAARASMYEGVAVIHMQAPTRESGLLQALRKQFAGKVHSLAELELEVFSGSAPWTGVALPLAESELAWVIQFTLAAAVHAGDRAIRTRGARFEEWRSTLRATKIALIPDLRVRLAGQGAAEPQPLAAVWVPDRKQLLVSASQGWSLEALAHPLQQALGRTDLSSDLRLGLAAASRIQGPHEALLRAATAELEIAPADLEVVRHRLADDLVHCRDLLRPVVRLFGKPEDVERLLSAESEKAVEAVLDAVAAPLDASSLVRLAQESRNVGELGLALHGRVGSVAELGAWNAALHALGMPPAAAPAFADEWRRKVMVARTPLRAMIASAVSDGARYASLGDAMDQVKPPESLGLLYWVVPFGEVVTQLTAPLRDAIPATLLDQVVRAGSPAELKEMLETHGVDTTLDPAERLSMNQGRGLLTLTGILEAALAWCRRNDWQPGALVEAAEHRARLEASMSGGAGPLRTLSDPELYQLACGAVARDPVHEGFWTAAAAVNDVAALRDRLGISVDEVEEATEALKRAAEVARRKARSVELLGSTFESTEEALAGLWTHVDGLGPAIGGGAGVDLEKLAPIREPPERRPRTGAGSAGKGTSEARMSDAQKELVGFAGEALAFKLLRARYGVEKVPATAWVSKASAAALGPRNETSDDLGYDFHLVDIGGKELFLEVKATTGDRCEFALGSSEIRKAGQVAGDPSSKYVILHITGMASPTPTARPLPNPFESGCASLFKMEGAGQRVRYLLAEE